MIGLYYPDFLIFFCLFHRIHFLPPSYISRTFFFLYRFRFRTCSHDFSQEANTLLSIVRLFLSLISNSRDFAASSLSLQSNTFPSISLLSIDIPMNAPGIGYYAESVLHPYQEGKTWIWFNLNRFCSFRASFVPIIYYHPIYHFCIITSN